MGQSSFVPFHKGNGTGGTHGTRLRHHLVSPARPVLYPEALQAGLPGDGWPAGAYERASEGDCRLADHPERYRVLMRMHLTKPGGCINPGKMRNFLALQDCPACPPCFPQEDFEDLEGPHRRTDARMGLPGRTRQRCFIARTEGGDFRP